MIAGLTTHTLGLTLAGRPVLTDIDLAFAPGRVTVLLGPNGAGKSSLLACLSGLVVPQSGEARLDGTAIPALHRRDRARRIGLLPQSGEVHWSIDVQTLVALGRIPRRGRWGEADADRAAIAQAMAATDVARFATRGVGTLSGGERGRVLLARVLAGQPDWLLADEPLANLDPAHQLDILDRLRDIAATGAGVVLVLHDLNQAARVADAVVLLRDGRVIAHGPPDTVLTEHLLAKTYGVAVHIGRTPTGERFVVPVRRV